MPTSTSQNVGVLERRIIELLTTTNLTFKEIILQLDGENLSASIGVIRRINRDNRYRRPRYDSKLTPAQRESLVEELRDHQGVKPNLSLLAKRYGVCHGSVWYWWDKLNRVKQRCDSHHQRRSFKSSRSFLRRSQQMQFLSAASAVRHHQQHQQGDFIQTGGAVSKERHSMHDGNFAGTESTNLVGRVSVVLHDSVSAVELPILMFSRGSQLDQWPSMKIAGSPETAIHHIDVGQPTHKKLFELAGEALPLVKAEV